MLAWVFSCLAVLGAGANGWKLRLREGLRVFFPCSLCPWVVARKLACVFSVLAVLGAAANGWKLRLREFTFARCARGSCKRLETATARIYVRSLCCWAVARTLACVFSVLAVLQTVGNCDCANLRSLAVPLGGCVKACVSFFLPRCARGGCKRSETEIARIYVPTCCCGIGKSARRCSLTLRILTVGYPHVLTCTC